MSHIERFLPLEDTIRNTQGKKKHVKPLPTFKGGGPPKRYSDEDIAQMHLVVMEFKPGTLKYGQHIIADLAEKLGISESYLRDVGVGCCRPGALRKYGLY